MTLLEINASDLPNVLLRRDLDEITIQNALRLQDVESVLSLKMNGSAWR